MDPFSAKGEGLLISATQDDTRCEDGVYIRIDDALRKQGCGIILEVDEARALAAWILANTPDPAL